MIAPANAREVADKFDANKFVLVLFVITELVANIFCVNVFRKRRELDPSERVISVVGKISASMFTVPYRLVTPVTASVDDALRAPENCPVVPLNVPPVNDVPVTAPRLAIEE